MLFAAVPMIVSAQNTITIHQKDGKQFSFGFDEKPVVSFTDNMLVVKTTKTEIQYELALLSKFTFDQKQTAVDAIVDERIEPSVTLDEYSVQISGLKAGATATLLSADGKQLQSYRTDNEGTVSFSIAELPQGIYIIKSESLTCKILKK